MDIVRVLFFMLGVLVVGWTLLSAMRTVVLPRGAHVLLTQMVFQSLRLLFFPLARRLRPFVWWDHLLALFAPIGLLLLPVVWLLLIMGAFACMFWALGVTSWHDALSLSGSSLLTLGFAQPKDTPTTVLSFSEAILGLGIVSLLITYLPTLYNAFSRREKMVTRLARRIGSPPSPLALLEHFNEIQALDKLYEVWEDWEEWFAELEESHSSFPFLVFFRSPTPARNWLTAAGVILDCAALSLSTLEGKPAGPDARLTLRTGFKALQAIATTLRIRFDPEERQHSGISVTQAEYNEVYDRLAALGMPVVPDREQGWQEFVNWRRQYDEVLLGLSERILAPYAPWVSDRATEGAVGNMEGEKEIIKEEVETLSDKR